MVLWIVATHNGYLTFFENKAMDWRYRVRGEIDAPVKLIYVDLNAESIRKWLGEKPWPREEFGRIAQILLYLGEARVIAFDLVLSEFTPSILVPKEIVEEDIAEFSKVSNRHPNIILAAAYSEGDEVPLIYKGNYNPGKSNRPETPLFQFTKTFGTNQMGLINVDVEKSGDSAPRWVPFFTEKYDEIFDKTFTYYQIALQMARTYYGLPPESIRRFNDRIEIVDGNEKVLVKVPLWEKQMVEVNYFSKFRSEKNPRFGMYDVAQAFALHTEGDELQQQQAERFFSRFKDSIIFIGPTDPLLQDIAPTPMDDSPVPKVGVHANVLKTIFSGLYIKRLPAEINHALTVLLTLAVGLLATRTGLYDRRVKLLGGILLLFYIFLVFQVFWNYHLVIPLIAPVGSAVTASLLGAMVQLVIEERSKSRITEMFGTYLNPDLVNSMIESGEDPHLGGISTEITAFFSDVQSFSSFSEKLTPGQLVELMNEYLTAMTDILMDEGCFVDKYEGDAIIGFFNAPVPMEAHPLHACIATQRMQEKQAELREKWEGEGDKWPPIVSKMRTRIGLNTGQATVGNMGSDQRFDYTMMGDTVNLAARCESGAKVYGVFTMVTGETKAGAEANGVGCIFRYLDKIVVQGRTQPAEVFEVMGLTGKMTDEASECLDLYNQGMEHYLAQDWDRALEFSGQSLKLEPNRPELNPMSPTNPSDELIKRALKMKENPPGKDWDGVYVMTEK